MIGYYAHHVGAGHVTRATVIARHLRTPVTGLSSRDAPSDWPGEWVPLARDDRPSPPPHADRVAGGALHWAPLHHDGLRARMGALASWIARARPALMVVDVSVEVTAFARLMGIPVITFAQQGSRADEPHRLGYRLATAVVAPWPDWVEPSAELATVESRLHRVGAFSRADGRAAPTRAQQPRADGRRRVLLMTGAGGSSITRADLAAARAATPAWSWTTIGPPAATWIADPWAQLCAADVVVTHAGQNAIAEVAAARRPAIVLPQERPYGEQAHTAQVLASAGLAVVRDEWPRPEAWPALLDAVARRDPGGWARWAPGDGAQRAARLLDDLAQRRLAAAA